MSGANRVATRRSVLGALEAPIASLLRDGYGEQDVARVWAAIERRLRPTADAGKAGRGIRRPRRRRGD